MEKIYLKGYVTKIDSNVYEVIASTDSVDRQGDSIDQSGWQLENYMRNPVMLWAHDYSELPVAKAIEVSIASGQLRVKFVFASAEANPKAAQIQKLYEEKFLNATSVGLIPLTRNGNIITKAELLEISFVPVPANQDALRLAMEKGLDVSLIKEDIEKGEVADVLSAEEMMEKKYENIDNAFEIMYAMCKVYCDEATPVEDFSKLLTEAIGLLTELATGGVETEGEKALKFKDISRLTVLDIIGKTGRKLSGETMKALETIHKCIKDADTAMEELKTSATSGDGSGDDEKSAEKVEVKNTLVLDSERVEGLRKLFQVSDKTHEYILSELKYLKLLAK